MWLGSSKTEPSYFTPSSEAETQHRLLLRLETQQRELFQAHQTPANSACCSLTVRVHKLDLWKQTQISSLKPDNESRKQAERSPPGCPLCSQGRAPPSLQPGAEVQQVTYCLSHLHAWARSIIPSEPERQAQNYRALCSFRGSG